MISALEDFSPDAPVGTRGQEGDDNHDDDEEEEDSDDDYCILEHPDKELDGLSHEVIIKSLADEKVNVVENHFSIPVGSVKAHTAFFFSINEPSLVVEYLITRCNLE